MKRTAYVLAALVALSPALHAQTAPEPPAAWYPWLVTFLETGFFHGTMSEFVYEGDRVLSRLDWEETLVPYINLTAEVNIKNILLSLNFLSALPSEGGVMEDFDYLDPGSTAHTHYSRHTALTEHHMEVIPSVGYQFRPGNFTFELSAGFMYRSRKWSAVDGYTRYAQTGQAWSESLPKQEVMGTVITYRETILLPLAALALGYSFGERFEARVKATWYPYLEVDTVDTHVLRQTRFHDTMKGGTGYFLDADFVYYPRRSDSMAFAANVGWEGISSSKGTISSGAVGWGGGLSLSGKNYSKIESSIWWFSIGVVIFPEKLWQF